MPNFAHCVAIVGATAVMLVAVPHRGAADPISITSITVRELPMNGASVRGVPARASFTLLSLGMARLSAGRSMRCEEQA
jgi:hypothetical protein